MEFYRQENESLKKRIHDLERENAEIKQKFANLNEELDRLQSLLGQKDYMIKNGEERTKEKEDFITILER